MAIINQSNILNLQPGITAPVVVHMSEGDSGTKLSFKLIDGARAWTDPGNVVAAVHGRRQDGTQFGPYACTISGDVVSFQTDAAIAAVAGSGIAQIVLTDSDQNTAGTANFAIMVERATFSMGVTYTNDVSVYEAILAYAQSADASLHGQINAEASARTSADSNLQSQINQIIAPSGEAPSAAEVQNARIGANGVTYDTLGDAIRGQVTDLKSALDELQYKTGNLFYVDDLAVDGLTITKNWDGTLTINGTTTKTTNVFIMGDSAEHPIQNIEPGTYTAVIELLSGTVSVKAALSLSYSNSITRWARVTDDPATVTFGSSTEGNARRVILRFVSGGVFANARIRITINSGTTITDKSPHMVTPDAIARQMIEDISTKEDVIPSPSADWVKHLDDKIDDVNAKIESLQQGEKSLHFLFFTDYHLGRLNPSEEYETNDRDLEPILNYIIHRTDDPYIVFGGDAINHPYEETRVAGIKQLLWFKDDFKHLWDKILPIIGNHDWSTYYSPSYYDNNQLPFPPSHMLSLSNLINAFGYKNGVTLSTMTAYGDYYVDDAVRGIRTIYVGCNVRASIVTAQATWFMETLASTPTNMSVLVVAHRFLGYHSGNNIFYVTDNENPFYPYQSVLSQATSIYAYGLAAFKARASVVLRGAAYDFTTKTGDAIGVISGHVHCDLCLYFTYDFTNDKPIWSTTYVNGYIPAMAVTCDAHRHSYIPGQNRLPVPSKSAYDSATKVNRETLDAGDIRRHAFDDVLVDMYEKKIYLTRFGAGDDAVMRYD